MANQTGLKHPHGSRLCCFSRGDVMFSHKQLLSHKMLACEGAEPLVLGLFCFTELSTVCYTELSIVCCTRCCRHHEAELRQSREECWGRQQELAAVREKLTNLKTTLEDRRKDIVSYKVTPCGSKCLLPPPPSRLPPPPPPPHPQHTPPPPPPITA